MTDSATEPLSKPMTYRKKLIEVALPLEAINAASAREKSIRHGHPSTLHLWWARRPLAACRAVLFASLVDDPDSDPLYRRPDGSVDEERAGEKRAELFTLIEDLVRWENSNNPTVINAARWEIARCVASRKIELGELKKEEQLKLAPPLPPPDEDSKATVPPFTPYDLLVKGRCTPEQVNAFLAAHAPPVLDPFCGGGSIPLEAQRLGLRAYGSDLNPVPVLITKALIEIPPKFAGRPPVNPEWQKKSKQAKAAKVWEGAQGLAEDVRYYGQWMRDEAEKRIGHLYPKVKITKEMAKDRPDLKEYVGEELTVIAWLWARTVASPDPAARGIHVPLLRSYWLSSKRGKEAWIEPLIDRKNRSYQFRVRVGPAPADMNPEKGTIGRGADICLLTGTSLPRAYIRAEATAGRLGNRLLAMVVEGSNERLFLAPPSAEQSVDEPVLPSWHPDAEIPNTRYTTPVIYGMTSHASLYTARQLVALDTFSSLVEAARDEAFRDASGDATYADSLATYLAFGVSKLADRGSTLSTWDTGYTKIRATFGRQALSMTWDYAEANPFSGGSGNWTDLLEWTARCTANWMQGCAASVEQRDARHSIEPTAATVVSTDPPYYDNVPYADLADFFYVWLRRSLARFYPQLMSTLLVPKAPEIVADIKRHGSADAAKAFFEKGMRDVFQQLRAGTTPEVPATVYYAFKQSETAESGDDDSPMTSSQSSTGWETFLQGLTESGWSIGGTWPMRTELGNRMRGMGSNALASSIVLVCRPRPDDAPLATRKQFLAALHKELPEALKNLQRGNIAPVDLAQAAIGPGMAVFTRYSKVMESDGTPMTVRTALALINQTLDEVLAEQEGEFDADTRWALAWFEQFGMADGPFGVAETLSKAKNTAVNGLVEAGVIAAKAGKVRLVKRDELDANWSPTDDDRLTIWETTQHLIRMLDQQGEEAAAALLHQLGGMAEIARDLAYRLYVICERKKWAEEALSYNGLVIAWPELTKLAQAAGRKGPREAQGELF